MKNDQPQSIELIHDDLKRYVLHDGAIVIYEVNGSSRDMVKVLTDTVYETAENWSLETPYVELVDVRNTHMTPYTRQKISELSKEMGHISGRTAILISDTLDGRLIGFFNDTTFSRLSEERDVQVFTEFDEALAWLEEIL